MWVVVWVRERPEEVREHLADQAARPRRVVATPTGTFLLGPAPGDPRTLRDGLRMAAYHGRPAVGLTWSDDDARVLVRRAGRVREHRLGAEPDPGLVRDLAPLLDGDDVRGALAGARGRGAERLRHFLELAGHGPEARVLEWVGRGGPDLVPVHRARWWERLIGEPRTARTPGRQILGRGRGAAEPVVVALLAVVLLAGTRPVSWLAAEVGHAGFGYAAVVVLVCAAATLSAHAALLFSRWRRVDPFPLSDPLGLARAEDGTHR